MTHQGQNFIINEQTLNLEQLKQWQAKPAPFTPGEPLFWDDPHISAQMLAAHLDPTTDWASRCPETIERSVTWLVDTLGLRPGAQILDLGCEPGLYATRLARWGLNVTGIDYSQRSIDYAVQYAREHGLAIRYRYDNYLDLADRHLYDAALLIYGDFCPLAPPSGANYWGMCSVPSSLGGTLCWMFRPARIGSVIKVPMMILMLITTMLMAINVPLG